MSGRQTFLLINVKEYLTEENITGTKIELDKKASNGDKGYI